ncbi:MAG TPA: nucleotidyltransferase domain-containing protein, partial [Gemmatimonadaceae bacterium]
MHPRAVAHVFQQIADLLELRGQDRFRIAAYRNAARAVSALDTDDIDRLLRDGELTKVNGIGPATLGVITELVETGESSFLEQLREDTPDGLVEMLRIPGLGPSKIHAIHEGLGVETVHDLEQAARDGRLAALPRFGAKTAEKVQRGVAYLRERNAFVLFAEARADAERLRAAVARQPGVARVEIAGSIRRRCEIVRDVDLVVACRDAPTTVAAALARGSAVRDAVGAGGSDVSLRLVDGARVDAYCTTSDEFAVAWWRATGSASHEREIHMRAAARGLTIIDNQVRDRSGRALHIPDEETLYRAVGLPYI